MHFSFSQIVVIEKKQHQKGKRSQNIWRHSLSCALEVWDSRNKKLPVSVCPCKLYLAPHIADIWAIIRSCTFPHCLLSCSTCLPSCAFCYLAMPLLSMCILSFVLENKRSLIINHSPTKKRKVHWQYFSRTYMYNYSKRFQGNLVKCQFCASLFGI